MIKYEIEREREKKEIILLYWNGIHMRFYLTKYRRIGENLFSAE